VSCTTVVWTEESRDYEGNAASASRLQAGQAAAADRRPFQARPRQSAGVRQEPQGTVST